MPQTYRVKLSDGREFDVTTNGPPPSERDVLAGLSSSPAEQAPAVPVAPPTPPRAPTTGESIGGMTGAVVDVGIGAAKGLGNTAFGLGKLVRDFTPVGRISDAIMPGAFDERPEALKPQNAAQTVGYTGEQIGEFFVPSAALAKLGKGGAVARSIGQTMAQTNEPVAAGVSGALTAAIPGGSAVKRGADMLEESAQKSVAQALGATKEWAKAEAAKLAPQMLKRGVGGSRDSMLTLAKQTSARVGKDLDDAYAAAAAAGEKITSRTVRDHIRTVADSLKIVDGSGKRIIVPGTERVISRLNKLDDFVGRMGAFIPIDKAAHIKRTWDKLVDKAGLFGAKAGANATDQADAWAIKEASDAFRTLINRNPTIADLNAELSFWTGLKKVLKETGKRTQAQSSGLGSTVVGAAGVGAGAMQGDSVTERVTNAALGGFAAKRLTQLLQSPWFRTQASAPLKHKLAEALGSGSPGRVLTVVEQMSKQAAPAVPSQVAQ